MSETSIEKRLAFLWQSAEVYAETPLSAHFCKELLRLAQRHGTALPSRVLHRICSGCCSLMRPGKNCIVTERVRRRSSRSRRRLLLIRCHGCEQTTEFALPPKPPARAAASHQKMIAVTPTSKKKVKPNPARQMLLSESGKEKAKKPPRKSLGAMDTGTKKAATPMKSTPTASSTTGFFGFDFVPVQ
mmetsp:Transcript_7085/g.13886  ORF Transcript_7085/g.13886 Transcript_7085/m.13886 type:complete len:187 (-) Transcript_7085:439-999(-)